MKDAKPSTFEYRVTQARAYLHGAVEPVAAADSQLDELRSSLNSGRLVIFAASGISLFSPSCMPAGAVFSSNVLHVLMETDPAPSANYVVPRVLQELLSRVPFEVILHFGRLAVGSEKLLTVLASLYSRRKFNSVHQALAELMLQPCRPTPVVTPNYDVLIEEAIRSRVGASSFEEALKTAGILRVCQPSDRRDDWLGPILFKIHGSIDLLSPKIEPVVGTKAPEETVVFELPQEAQLPIWKRNALSDLLAGKDVLFVGYGGWDFDILPVLMEVSLGRVWWNCYKNPQTAPQSIPDEVALFIASNNATILFGDLRELFSKLVGMPITTAGDCVATTTVRDELVRTFQERHLQLWYGTLLARVGFGAEAKKVLEHLTESTDELATKAYRELGHALFHMGLYTSSYRSFRHAAHLVSKQQGTSTDVINIWLEAVEALLQQWRWLAALWILLKCFLALRGIDKASEAEIRHRRGLLYRLIAKHPVVFRKAWRQQLNAMADKELSATEPIGGAMAARSLLQVGAARPDALIVDLADVRLRFRRLGHAIAEINSYRDEGKRFFEDWLKDGATSKLLDARTALEKSLHLAIERADLPGEAKALYELGRLAEAQAEFGVGVMSYKTSRQKFRKLEDGTLPSMARWTKTMVRELICRTHLAIRKR